MTLTSLSIYGISNTKDTDQSQNGNSSESSFSEKIVRLNQEIRLNYIKLSEQSSRSQRKPSETPKTDKSPQPAVKPKTDEAA